MKKLIISIILFLPFFAFSQIENMQQISPLINQMRYDEGLEIIKKIIKNKQASNITYYYKACCEQGNRNFESSIESATTALKMTNKTDTLYPHILSIRALSYAYAGKINLGIADNEIVIKENPDNVYFLVNMSYLYGENRQFYNCIKTLKHAITLDSLNVYLLNNLAYYNCEAKDYKATIKYAMKGLKLAKDSTMTATLLNSLGFAEAKIVSVDKGLQTIEKSITYWPSNPYAYNYLGLIYLDKKEIDEACKNFNIAKQLGGANLTEGYIKQYCE